MNPTLPLPLLLGLLCWAAVVATGAGAAGGQELRRTANTSAPGLPFSAAVELGDFVYVSGALSVAQGTTEQTKETLDSLEKTLNGLGLDLTRVVEARVYLSDARTFPAVDAEIGRRFGNAPPTMAVVEAALVVPGAEVEIAVVAAKKGVAIESILPDGWRAPQGHFRRALRAGNTLFLAGQVGYDIEKGVVPPGGVKAQLEQAFANVRRLVEKGGLSLASVTNCRVFLADARDFPLLNEVWKKVFPSDPPVRETLQAKLADPDFKVEVHCQAVYGERQVVQPGAAGSPFSTTTAGDGRLYTAGMVARSPDGWASGPGEQTRVILDKLGAALKEAGLTPNDVAEATVVLADPRYFEAMNAEYRKFFPAGLPARVTAAMPLMAPEGLVEISFIAQRPKKQP